jgi:hypothetical protein
MTIESSTEQSTDQSKIKAAPAEATAPRQEEFQVRIVPPPIPGQTGWSIVPW